MATRQQKVRKNARRAEAVKMNTQLLNYDDAAKRLGVSRNTVKAMVAEGKIRVVDLGRKTKRIRESDIEALIDAKTT